MSVLAARYFKFVDENLSFTLCPTPRQLHVLHAAREDRAQYFLLVAPISGLSLTIPPRQYRSILQYRLSVPMFIGYPTCPSCELDKMDPFGDHALHCSRDIGTKHRHNMVRDVLADICFKAGDVVQKEAHTGMSNAAGVELRSGDLLVYGWDKGRDTCVDVVGASPFTTNANISFLPGNAVYQATLRKKKKKYLEICSNKGYDFMAFAFSTFGELGDDASGFLKRIKNVTKSHENGSKCSDFTFQRVSFTIQKGVRAQFITRLPTNFV